MGRVVCKIAPLMPLVLLLACNSAATFRAVTLSQPSTSDSDQAGGGFEYEVVAGEKASVNLGEITHGRLKKLLAFDKERLPADAYFDAATKRLEWQTDLQDIGASFQSVASLLQDDDGELDITFKVNVIAPKAEAGSCDTVIPPVIGDVKPQQAWHWPGIGPYTITYSAPVAADLDGDGQVEIVSVPSTTLSYEVGTVPIAVLNAKTGALLWNSLDSGFGAQPSTTPSLADLDGDGNVEIVVASPNPTGGLSIIIVDYKSKSVKARYSSPDFNCGTFYCNTAIGDIDGDGSPEIVAGNTVLRANGTKKFLLNPDPVLSPDLKVATIANLVPSSLGEEIVISGSQVYSSSGSLLWQGSCNGLSAVADLEGDGKAELVCIGGGEVHVYSDSGSLRWKRDIPNSGVKRRGGAPNVGDFNGDGKMEIGTAGGEYYVVFDKDGNELWKRQTQDGSSLATGSSLFDFNGDGKVEVVYNDELALMIYDGATGNLLFSESNSSGTLWEYPLILNVDDDSSVEIIVSSPDKGGVRMFKDPTKLWVSSRRLWNQYSYFPEAVDDKVRMKSNPGITKTGFRVNTSGGLRKGDRKPLADIQAKIPKLFDRKKSARDSEDVATSKLTVFLFNAGEAVPSDDVSVDVYVSEPLQLVGEVTVKADELQPAKPVIMKVDVPAEAVEQLKKGAQLRLNLDQDGNLRSQECKSDNNQATLKPIKL